MWNAREQRAKLIKVSKLLTKAAWGRIPATMIKQEVKAVLLDFWKTYKKLSKHS